MLRCRTCKARFSERNGAPLFNARLPPEKVESVLEHVAEGCGVRQTGRPCRVAPNTVARDSRIAGERARAAHDELVELSPPGATEVQFPDGREHRVCWSVWTLTVTDAEGSRARRSPAMAAGLTDHVWSMFEWLSRPAVPHS